jgi:hypothetical protein
VSYPSPFAFVSVELATSQFATKLKKWVDPFCGREFRSSVSDWSNQKRKANVALAQSHTGGSTSQ